jgi:putative inorganic carbon (HCO3(-)) transporter
VIALNVTQSRGGLIGVLAVLGAVGWNKLRSRTLLLAAGLVGALGLYAAMGISERVSGGTSDLGDESEVTRLYAWEAALRMALARPLTGVGLENFEDNFFFFTPVWSHHNYTAHSVWFLVLGEIGVPGLIAFASMIWFGVHAAVDSLRRLDASSADARMHAISLGVLSGLLGFCAAGSFLSAAYGWSLYILVALAAALAHFAEQKGRIEAPLPSDSSHHSKIRNYLSH